MNRFRWIAAMVCLAIAVAGASAQTPAPAPPVPGSQAPAGGATAEPPAGAPKIRFESTTLDLGNVKKGDDAIAEFVFKNEGDAPLKILAAKPG